MTQKGRYGLNLSLLKRALFKEVSHPWMLFLPEIDVKKLLSMFAISISSALVVSLKTRILGIFECVLVIFKIDVILFLVFLMLSQLVSK